MKSGDGVVARKWRGRQGKGGNGDGESLEMILELVDWDELNGTGNKLTQ